MTGDQVLDTVLVFGGLGLGLLFLVCCALLGVLID